MESFINAVAVINNGEVTIQELHDAFSGPYGIVDGQQLLDIEYFAAKVQELLHLINQTRASY